MVCAAMLALCLSFLLFAVIAENSAFGKRYDKNPLFKYFTAEDFSLSAEPVALPKGLNGFIYRNGELPQRDKLIIFCHGMGAGHIAHTTEIAYFCNRSFPVLAVDARGCNFSGGKSIKGMYSGVQAALCAIDYAKERGFENIYLVGHSWGGYSALCASAKAKVSGVVALGAPDTPSKTMQVGAINAGVPRAFASILRPCWWFYDLLKFGANGNLSASRCVSVSGTKTLLIHGDKDGIVPFKDSALAKGDGEHITKIIAQGKGHNPYNTENAETLLATLIAMLKSRDIDGVRKFDFKAATEQDERVMQTILNFIDG